MRLSGSLVLAGLIPALALSACNRSGDDSPELGSSVDKLATQAPPPAAPPPPGAPASAAATAPGQQAAPPQPVIHTDPRSASCGAGALASFIGKADSQAVRNQISTAAKAPGGIRFVLPGDATTMDFRDDRLNVMIDVTGVIRDLRCG